MGVLKFASRLCAAFRARTGVNVLVPLAVAAGFALLLFKLDPFGIGDASHARSEQATLRITAPFYHPSGRVTVVYLDDEYITNRKAGWPLRYAEQGRLMRAILSAKPAVLLVDLVYPHQHATTLEPAPTPTDPAAVKPADNIAQLLSPILKDGGIPIVFTGMAKSPEALKDFEFCSEQYNTHETELLDPNSMLSDMRATLFDKNPNAPGSQVHLGYVRWSGCADRYPLLLGGNDHTVTPAFAAYRAYCDRQSPERRKEAHCDVSPPRERPEAYLHPMIVRSGAFPPASQQFAFDENTCQKPGKDEHGQVGLLRQGWTFVQQMALGMFKDLRTDENKQLALPCPALTIVPMSLLEKASAAEWRELLQDRAVVLGANLSGIPDVIGTQVHGQVPGVVWHGMALDNLMSQGSGYLAERHESATKVIKVMFVFLLAYLLPFLFKYIDHPGLKKTFGHASLSIWLLLAILHFSAGHVQNALIALVIGVTLDLTKPTLTAGYFLAMMLAGIFSGVSLWQGWPPGNWFGLVLLAIAFMHALKPYYHGSERKQFPDKSSTLGALLKLNRQETANAHR